MTSERKTRLVPVMAVVAILGVAGGAWYAWRAGYLEVRRAAPAATQERYWTCVMHPEIRADGPGKCPKCGMDLVPSDQVPGAQTGAGAPPAPGEPTSAAAGQVPAGPARAPVMIDARRQQLIGLRTAKVERRPIERTIRAVGTIRYDETRLADVNLKIDGWIRDLYVDTTGKFVRKGDPLFSLYSPDLLTTQNEYLLALKTRDQMQQSQIPEAREQADRLVQTARQRLVLWDLPADQIAEIERTRQPQSTVVFRSDVIGYVIEKTALRGMRVMAGQMLYKIADLSVVWLEADFYEREMAHVRVGQRADVALDAYPGDDFSGRVVYIYPFVEEQTRTVRVRFALPNPGGRLKPGMFANVEQKLSLGQGLVVPTNAVIDSGERQVVFLSVGEGYFEPRDVKVGARLENVVQIVGGLEEGDEVAAAANFFIDADSQLQAALQGFSPLAPPAPAEGGESGLQIDVHTVPDPPRSGDNQVEVAVRDAGGKPVADVEVVVTIFMAAMPSMNMPAMRSDAKLPHMGGGVYRGTLNVPMLGRWDATVAVVRGGKHLDARHLSLVAR